MSALSTLDVVDPARSVLGADVSSHLAISSLVAPPPILLHPAQPISSAQLKALQRRSSLHPSNPNYRSLVSEAHSANGFPISSWRWLRVGREWWSILRRELWKETTVGGFEP